MGEPDTPEFGAIAVELNKIFCYSSMAVAGLLVLIFLLDAAAGVLGRTSIALDILFIIGGAFIIWQGVETARELR